MALPATVLVAAVPAIWTEATGIDQELKAEVEIPT